MRCRSFLLVQVHTIRDHPLGHDRPINGGLWGGVKQALGKDGTMAALVSKWSKRDSYGADLAFLTEVVWPLVQVMYWR